MTNILRIIKNNGLGDIIEVIVSNNASIDGTEEVALSLKEIVYYKQPANIGGDANFIFLLKKASSKYSLLLSDDDILSEDGLLALLRTLERYSPDIVIAKFITNGHESFNSKITRMTQHKPTMAFGEVNCAPQMLYFISGFVIKRENLSEEEWLDIMQTNFRHMEYALKVLSPTSMCMFQEEILVERIEKGPIKLNSNHWKFDLSGSRVTRKYQEKFNFNLSPVAEISSCLSYFVMLKDIEDKSPIVVFRETVLVIINIFKYASFKSILYAPIYYFIKGINMLVIKFLYK